MELFELTAGQLRQAALVKEKIVELEGELTSILGEAGSTIPGRKLHWSQTSAGRAKLAATARRRWRSQRGSAKSIAKKSAGNGSKVHWTQTPAGRAKMARLMQRRWNARRKKAA